MISIILCNEKDETVVKYSVMSDNEKLFASKYRTYLPDERIETADRSRQSKISIGQSRLNINCFKISKNDTATEFK